jgi:hypothetical protein
LVELCLHIANVVYLLSFLDRDMLRLRALTCVGMMLGIVFFSCQPRPLYGPTAWHVVFLVINGFQIRHLVRERRRLMLTEEQERFGEATFHDFSREELLTLLTRVLDENPERLQDVTRICHQPLTREQRVLRDVAFSRLSRNELLNLLTRRLWNSMRRRGPSRRRGQRRLGRETAPDGPEREVARGSVAG